MLSIVISFSGNNIFSNEVQPIKAFDSIFIVFGESSTSFKLEQPWQNVFGTIVIIEGSLIFSIPLPQKHPNIISRNPSGNFTSRKEVH